MRRLLYKVQHVNGWLMVKRASLVFLSFYMYFLMNATSLETMWRTVKKSKSIFKEKSQKMVLDSFGFCLLRLTGVFSVFQNWMNDCHRVSINGIKLSFSNTNENYDHLFREEHKLKCQMPKCLSCGTKQKPKHSGFFPFFCSTLLNMKYFLVSSNGLRNMHK